MKTQEEQLDFANTMVELTVRLKELQEELAQENDKVKQLDLLKKIKGAINSMDELREQYMD